MPTVPVSTAVERTELAERGEGLRVAIVRIIFLFSLLGSGVYAGVEDGCICHGRGETSGGARPQEDSSVLGGVLENVRIYKQRRHFRIWQLSA